MKRNGIGAVSLRIADKQKACQSCAVFQDAIEIHRLWDVGLPKAQLIFHWQFLEPHS